MNNRRLFNDLQRIALSIHEYLSKHLENEDILFKTNWRHAIPIPFIGKKIPFDVAANNCGKLRLKISVDQSLLTMIKEENADSYLKEVMNGMDIFLVALINEVKYLEHFSIRLDDRAAGKDMFSFSEYNEMFNEYQRLSQERQDAGAVMNYAATILELKYN